MTSASAATSVQGHTRAQSLRAAIAPWARGYQRAWLRSDVIVGIALGFVVIPQGMAYAELAGMPLVTGLYATILAVVGYAILGSSRQLVVGPDSSTSTLVAAAVIGIAGAGAAPDRYAAVATGIAIVAGVILLVGSFLKLGLIAAFLSRPVLAGYLNGLSITIIVGQLPKILGVSAKGDDPITKLGQIVANLADLQLAPLAVGIVSLAALLVLPRVLPKIPAALIVIVVAIIAVPVLGLDQGQLSLVGVIPQGLPMPSIPALQPGDVSAMVGPAAAIALMGFADTTLTAQLFARRNSYRVDANKDLMGLGLGSLLSGLFGGFGISGSDSRTAVAERAGGRTQMANLVAVAVVALVLVFASGLLRTLPYAVLAAIIVSAALGLFDFRTFQRARRQERVSFWLGIVALVGTLLLGLLPGIILAVMLSLTMVLLRGASARLVVLGRGETADDWRDVEKVPTAIVVPGALVVRYQAELFFANAERFRSQLEEAIAAAPEPVRWVILDAESTGYVDYSALEMLAELTESLDRAGIRLAVASATGATEVALMTAGLTPRLVEGRLFGTVDGALRAYATAFPEASARAMPRSSLV